MKRLLMAAVMLVPAWNTAQAGDSRDLRVRVGLGAQFRPKFIGADKNRLAPLWDFHIAHGTDQFRFQAPDDGLSIGLISKDGFRAGPVANLASGRKDLDVGAPLDKVGATFEAGAFAQYEFSDAFRMRAELRKGIGGHQGLVGAVGVDKIWRDGDRYVFSIGPRLLFSDGRYQRAYFGVTPTAALATGLPAYRPDGGLHAVAVVSGLSYQFDPHFGMFSFARYEKLVGNAAKSPVIRQLGSRDQVSAGIGLNYTFKVRL
jgi:outer membrane protein